MTKEYQDPEVLTDLYHGQEMSTYDLADHFGVSHTTIHYWMKKHDIERRRCGRPGSIPSFFTHKQGYEKWSTQTDYKKEKVLVHRLLAVAEYGFDAVVDMDVHHRNHIPWDNRAENLELLSKSDHAAYHNKNRIKP